MSSSRAEVTGAIQAIIDTYSMSNVIQDLDLDNVPDEVYLIPDVHGRNDLLQAALAKVSDRSAVMMLGDFGDRGPDSLGVYESIFRFNKQRVEKGISPIVAVPGNHEENFLALFIDRKIAEIVIGKEGLKKIDSAYEIQPTLDIVNWPDKLKEMSLNENQINPVLEYIKTRQFMELDTIGGQWASDLICKKNGGEEIAKYIASLPIILDCHIPVPFSDDAKKQFAEWFVVVHSVLPVTFEEFDHMESLTQRQQFDALNIRLRDLPCNALPMNPELPIVFAGHSIVNKAEEAVIGQHVDLDMGACMPTRGVLFMYAVKANKMHLIVDPTIQNNAPFVVEHFAYIAKHIETTIKNRRIQLQKSARLREEKTADKENINLPVINSVQSKATSDRSALVKHTFLNQAPTSHLKRKSPTEHVPVSKEQTDKEPEPEPVKIKLGK